MYFTDYKYIILSFWKLRKKRGAKLKAACEHFHTARNYEITLFLPTFDKNCTPFLRNVRSLSGNLSPAMGRGISSSNRVWNWVAKLHIPAGRHDDPGSLPPERDLSYRLWPSMRVSVTFLPGLLVPVALFSFSSSSSLSDMTMTLLLLSTGGAGSWPLDCTTARQNCTSQSHEERSEIF